MCEIGKIFKIILSSLISYIAEIYWIPSLGFQRIFIEIIENFTPKCYNIFLKIIKTRPCRTKQKY